jgi:3-deoxy-7-phosphoheptulonate synthase
MEFLPSYKEIKTRFPLLPSQHLFIEESRQTVRAILNGTDPRLLLIVGPCSIHDRLSAKEFAVQLHKLAYTVASHFFLVMRVYCEKPRTASGWKGFLYDPLLDGSHAMHLGIEWTRQLLLELATLQVPAATEFLDPLTAYYYEDLMTWGSIGARTASSQTHRQLASALPMPIGFKNGVAGNVSAAVNGAMAASHPHTYMRICENGKPIIARTMGNPDTHVVLRGGESGPNYDPSSVSEALARLEHAKLPLRLLIDCSHHNSAKKHDRQPGVFQSVIHQIIEGNTNIRGLMLESHLHAGNQILTSDLSQLQYGISITDACLDWHSTAHLISWGARHLHQQSLTTDQTVNTCHSLARSHHF